MCYSPVASAGITEKSHLRLCECVVREGGGGYFLLIGTYRLIGI